MRARGQADLWHFLGPLLTAGLVGGAAFIWGQIRPEPKEDQAKAVALALQAREVAELRRVSDEHTAELKIVLPQLQRIEDAVTALREGGVRTAAGKR